jgi:hypothetical protein
MLTKIPAAVKPQRGFPITLKCVTQMATLLQASNHVFGLDPLVKLL